MKNFIDGFIRFNGMSSRNVSIYLNVWPTSRVLQALFITCADSRIVPDLIMQTEPGDLFICRNAGNIVPPYGEVHGGVSATIEYAVACAECLGHYRVRSHGLWRDERHPET